jgi:phospholipid/cholesterol/gamma-HCH transport system substrate-binding protein
MNRAKLAGAGAFVLLGLLLFTVALFMIGERRMLFDDRFEVNTEFKNLGQLELGAVVRVSGMDAGEVTDIRVPPSPAGKFRVTMELRQDLHGLVRTDSVAATQMEGLVGAIFVHIAAGTEQAPRVPEGGTIPSREPLSMADLLEQASATITLVTTTVEDMRGDVERAIQQIALTAEDAHALVEDLRPDVTAIARNGARISADVRAISEGIANGEGTMGRLVRDPALYDRMREISEEARTVMTNLREVSDEARRAIADFRSSDGPAQGLLGDMRVTLGQTREAVTDLADNMEALKHNFLLRGFFNRRGYFDLDALSPADYRSGVLENGGRKAARIWLASRVLFETRPDGSEVLTAEGKARLDSAMSTYLEYVPANPIVVEGYATGLTVDERYRTARQRAGMVREYLMGRFALTPQNTGFIALGDEAQNSPEGDGRWDGVALTLFLDREALQIVPQPRTVARPLERTPED